MDPTPALSIAYSSTSSEEGWQDVEPDGEDVLVVSLFDDTTFSDARSMLDYCRDRYGFDFLETRRRLGLDFLGAVKLCNFGMIYFCEYRLLRSMFISPVKPD